MEQTTEKKKDRSIRPAVIFVIIFGLVASILIAIPIYRHRQFVAFMSDLSAMTTRAGTKEMVTCELDGEEFAISSDAAHEIYSKMVSSESLKLIEPDEELAANGFTLTYGLFDAKLRLAPAQYQDEQALYVDYHSGITDYTFIAPHLDYKDVYRTVTKGRLP